MTNRSLFTGIVLPAIILIAGFAAVFALTGFIERSRPPLPDGYDDSDLTVNGSSLKGYAFGTEGLIADYYFMRSLQYIGDKLVNDKGGLTNIDDLRVLNPRLLYPLLNNATDLDPHFIAAYSFGAVVLPAIDPDKAIALAEKGIANNPDHWRLYQYLAYIYWRLGKYDKAADYYEMGAMIPDSSSFMKLMAASMKTEGGSRDTARTIYQEMATTSDDEQVRGTATRRLLELDSLDECDAINKTLADFKQSNGHCPNSFGEITGQLIRVKLPHNKQFHIDKANRLVDPTDASYLLDKEKCVVKLDVEHTGLPLR